MSSRPVLLGVTGGIGSGKSIITKILGTMQIPVYNSDNRARELSSSKEALTAIRKYFGDSYIKNNQLDRRKMADLIFNDPDARVKLNQLIHPLVAADFKQWVNQLQKHPILVKEAALLIESDSYQELDYLLLVTAPSALRLSRVLKRDPFRTREEVLKIMESQLTDQEKARYTDFIIENSESELITPGLIEILKSLEITS